jgi:cell division protease FtsH
MMGAERRSLVMTKEERRLTAYHEGGHALVTVHCPQSDPIHKATIVPRGRALGMVMRLPETDRLSLSREKILADITVAMGGRIAEELVFGSDKVTSGASSDIQMATSLARSMVTQYGMSEKLGPLTYAENEQEIFLGHSVTQTKHISEATAEIIDSEVRSIVDLCYKRAHKILSDNLEKLHDLAKALLDYETLTGDEIVALLKGESIVRPDPADLDEDAGKRASVPSSGSKGAAGSLEPEPQPGS